MEVICPFCKSSQKQKPLKSWGYGHLIEKNTVNGTKKGSSINCSRYLCICEKYFNFYQTVKGKTWTNPKPKK